MPVRSWSAPDCPRSWSFASATRWIGLGQLQGPVDFALIDLWKDLYIPCFDLLLPRLAAGAFVVADNMLLPPSVRRHAERYQQHVRSTGRFDSVLLPVGGGLEISRLRD
jgi:predicted O-methyltransferase YrrM